MMRVSRGMDEAKRHDYLGRIPTLRAPGQVRSSEAVSAYHLPPSIAGPETALSAFERQAVHFQATAWR
jgi:hypothetical protein